MNKLLNMYRRLILLFFAVGLGSAATAQTIDTDNYRTIDGTFNNLTNPDWGAAGTDLLRIAPATYADGISAPTGVKRPHPRTVSNQIFAQAGLINDPLQLSDFCWVWGQFIDHDLGLTPDGAEDATLRVPTGDSMFDPIGMGRAIIPMSRNVFNPSTGTDPSNPRQHPNMITAFVDASGVYGSEEAQAAWLRTFQGGKLKTSAGNMLPYNTVTGEYGDAIDPNAPHMDDAVRLSAYHFVAGDVRANENPLLAGFHTLFVREHNRQCDRLARIHPNWSDEQLYQYARKIVGGLIQSILYDEWLPAMGVALPTYTGYHADVHPQLDNVFTGAAFRLGHTLINSQIRRLDKHGNVIPEGNISLRNAFFNTAIVREMGSFDPFFAGMAEQTQQSFDSRVVDDVRNFLFGPPGAGGLDLASININRGRERGLPDFNSVRRSYGLQPHRFFVQLTTTTEVFSRLQMLYVDINNIDPWVGLLAETPMPGALFGETVLTIMQDQFTRLRDGDRFFYLIDPVLSEADKEWITEVRFRDIVMYNTGIKLMQDNVFLSMPHNTICDNMNLVIRGRVRTETNAPVGNVRLEMGMGADKLEVTTTDNGSYRFNSLRACKMEVLRPSREDRWSNGLSTFDLILIQRHILGISELNSPYKIIAADVNQSGSVSTLDLLQIRRVILGLSESVADNAPWRFVLASYRFSDPQEPLAEDFPEVLDFDRAASTDFLEGFIAIKLGDVNNSASVNNSQDDRIEQRSLATGTGLLLSIPDRTVAAGDEWQLTIAGQSQQSLAGFQLALQLNGLSVVEATSALGTECVAQTAPNQVRLSYYTTDAWTGHDAVLQLSLRADRPGQLRDMIELGQGLSPEAYTTQDVRQPVRLSYAPPQTGGVAVGRLYPNPVYDRAILPLDLAQAGQVSVSVYDATGRRVYYQQQYLAAGPQTWVMLREQLPLATGAYFYRVDNGSEQHTGRFILE